jgi:hypothetical protein
MKFVQLSIIFLIIFLFLYISYRLIQKQNTKYVYEGFQEGLETTTITNTTDKMLSMPLNQVCIKASYNSAFDGKNISIDQLKYVMSKGCRFLDFELYLNEKDKQIYVNYSTDPTYTTYINTNTSTDVNSPSMAVSFNQIMAAIIDSSVKTSADGKNTYVTPNPNDPLFIQLRIKTDFKKNDNSVYKAVADVLSNFTDQLYKTQITGDVKLSDLKNKKIIVMDKSINPNYPEDVLAPYVNIVTGGTTWSSQQYSLFKNQKTTPPKIKDDFKTTDVTQLKLLMPDVDENSPNPQNPFSLIESYGVQAIAYKFYKRDMALDLYETIFAEYQSAFVPLAYVIQFIQNKKQQPDEKMTLKYGASFVGDAK